MYTKNENVNFIKIGMWPSNSSINEWRRRLECIVKIMAFIEYHSYCYGCWWTININKSGVPIFGPPCHRLRSSASPVLTATHHFYGSPRLSDFFSISALGVRPSTDIHAKWLKQRAFTQGCAFCSKSRYFSYPLISRPPKRSKFCKFLDLEIFRSILAFNIRGHRENTPYSSSELNESGTLNRQSGGEKLKYVRKFYIGGTCHVIWRNDDSALCLWAHDVSGTISQNLLEIETWVQWTTNRK